MIDAGSPSHAHADHRRLVQSLSPAHGNHSQRSPLSLALSPYPRRPIIKSQSVDTFVRTDEETINEEAIVQPAASPSSNASRRHSRSPMSHKQSRHRIQADEEQQSLIHGPQPSPTNGSDNPSDIVVEMANLSNSSSYQSSPIIDSSAALGQSLRSQIRTLMLDTAHDTESDDKHAESLDYEANDDTNVVLVNSNNKLDEKSEYLKTIIVTIIKILTTCTVGVAIGLIGYCISSLVRILIHENIQLLNSSMATDKPNRAFALTALYSLALTLVASLCVTVGSWHVKGSGVGKLNAFLSGASSSRKFLTLRTLIFKMIGLTCSVSAGIKQGMEGPFIHLGAMLGLHVSNAIVWVFNLLMQLLCLTNNSYYKSIYASLVSVVEERMFISGGAAAGFSVAFNAPLAGVLYVQDGGFSYWNGEYTFRTFICTMMAVTTINLCYTHSNGILPSRGLIDLIDQPSTSIFIQEFWAFLILGMIGGLLGAAFTHLNVYVERKRLLYLGNKRLLVILDAALCCISTVLLGFALPFLFSCSMKNDACQQSTDRCLRFHCPPKQFSVIATFFFSLPEETIRILFDRTPTTSESAGMNDASVTIVLLLIYGAIYFLMAALSYGSAVPGGLFIPSIIIGACYGRIVGMAVASLINTSDSTLSTPSVSPGVYAVLGAASMLGGITRMTLPITVMFIEITSDSQFLIPIMMVVIVAKVISDRFIGALYSEHLKLDGLVLAFSDQIPKTLKKLQAKDVMGRMYSDSDSIESIVNVNIVDTVHNIQRVLTQTTHNAFPVCDTAQSTIGSRAKSRNQGGNPGQIPHSHSQPSQPPPPPSSQPTIPSELLHSPSSQQRGSYLGLISRRHLLSALNYCAMFDSEAEARDSDPITAQKLTRQSSRPSQHTRELSNGNGNGGENGAGASLTTSLSSSSLSSDLSSYINLCRYIDLGAHMVSEETPARRVWALFRSLGMRHIVVLNRRHQPVGMITRRDLIQHAIASQ